MLFELRRLLNLYIQSSQDIEQTQNLKNVLKEYAVFESEEELQHRFVYLPFGLKLLS